MSFLQKIANKNNLELVDVRRLSGGDINDVYLLKCTSENYVIKTNSASKFPTMFEAEADGLELLSASESFKIPSVITYGQEEDVSYLLMEYIAQGHASSGFWSVFAENLAKMHRTTNPTFGLDRSNYIGSLTQYNFEESSASDFYINQRLIPQFKMADERGFQFQGLETFFSNISNEIPNEQPSLLHGDLWSGNYLVSEDGNPVLIDPAVVYGPREMDIAMMHLFGGFSETVFQFYDEIFPMEPKWEERISFWQLYYVLVHLNIFGAGYLPQVKSILKRFS